MLERVFATEITENTEAWGRGIITTKGRESTKGVRLIGDHSPWLGHLTQVGMSVPAHPPESIGLFRRGVESIDLPGFWRCPESQSFR